MDDDARTAEEHAPRRKPSVSDPGGLF